MQCRVYLAGPTHTGLDRTDERGAAVTRGQSVLRLGLEDGQQKADLLSQSSLFNPRLFTAMKLIKFCRREHHISKSTTIRVETLHFYRNHDNRFIADPNEGTSSHSVSGAESISIPQDELELIFSGSNIKIEGWRMLLAPVLLQRCR